MYNPILFRTILSILGLTRMSKLSIMTITMIGNILHFKLFGLHKVAFHAFCHRVDADNTQDGAKKLVEATPEYQSLKNLRVDNNADNNTNEHISQGQIT